MIIDAYSHICPKEFTEAFAKVPKINWTDDNAMTMKFGGPGLTDVDARLELMGKYKDYAQVLTPVGELTEAYFGPEENADLCEIFNDSLAAIVKKYPEKFIAGVATVPHNNTEAALSEIDRAINKLGLKGIYLHTPVYSTMERRKYGCGYDYENVKALDEPEFLPIFEKMAQYDLPIWIHPFGLSGTPIYSGEARGKFGLPFVFGWPIETVMAMARIACSGIFAKYPNLKIITHHCGGALTPMLAGRIRDAFGTLQKAGVVKTYEDNKSMVDYFKMFYADTALNDNSIGLECGHDFFGVDHMLFASDYPMDAANGDTFLPQALKAVNGMRISDTDKEQIFEGNIRRLLHL